MFKLTPRTKIYLPISWLLLVLLSILIFLFLVMPFWNFMFFIGIETVILISIFAIMTLAKE